MSTTTDYHPGVATYVVRRVRRGARRVARALGLRLQPRPAWVRIVSGVVGLAFLVGAFFLLALFSVPSGVHGWLPSAAAYLPGLLLLTVGIGIGRWSAAIGWAAVVALLLGVSAHRLAPPTHERIEAVASQVGTPVGWTTVDDGSWSGNTWGLWSSWPQVTYTYTTSEPPERAAADYAARLEAEGWDQRTIDHGPGSLAPGTVSQTWVKGRWTVEVRVAGPGSKPRQFDTFVPVELTRVDPYVDGQG